MQCECVSAFMIHGDIYVDARTHTHCTVKQLHISISNADAALVRCALPVSSPQKWNAVRLRKRKGLKCRTAIYEIEIIYTAKVNLCDAHAALRTRIWGAEGGEGCIFVTNIYRSAVRRTGDSCTCSFRKAYTYAGWNFLGHALVSLNHYMHINVNPLIIMHRF